MKTIGPVEATKLLVECSALAAREPALPPTRMGPGARTASNCFSWMGECKTLLGVVNGRAGRNALKPFATGLPSEGGTGTNGVRSAVDWLPRKGVHSTAPSPSLPPTTAPPPSAPPPSRPCGVGLGRLPPRPRPRPSAGRGPAGTMGVIAKFPMLSGASTMLLLKPNTCAATPTSNLLRQKMLSLLLGGAGDADAETARLAAAAEAAAAAFSAAMAPLKVRIAMSSSKAVM
mmetsp:Transcript_117023/g.372533  ORF Transcript_117023/g.372533 Transcript_117023/m.372533 type:complete len:231 (+) Transcript_117023:508-1200(+)